jgi:histidinol-phosphate aminotransferase
MYSIGHNYQNESSIRLNLNEFDFEHPSTFLENVYDLNTINITHYSTLDNKNCVALKMKLSELNHISKDSILLTSGSDDALDYIVNSYVTKETHVCTLTPTYNYFEMLLKRKETNIHSIPIKLDYSLSYHLDYYLQVYDNAVVYIVNPNNPLGILHKKDEIKELLQQYPSILFIIDEAYIEFTNESCIEFINEYKNIIITRTFSKAYGLAGVRLGFIATCKENINKLILLYNEKRVTEFAKKAGLFVLNHLEYYNNIIETIQKNKQDFECFLLSKNIYYIKSHANFITIYVGDNIHLLNEELEKMNIYVRLKPNDTNMAGFMRITIGNSKSMNAVKNVFEKNALFQPYKNIKRYFIDGCFDGYHYGHVNAILQAKKMCDVLVCGTHQDDELTNTKGPPLFTYSERLFMLQHCRLIDEISLPVSYITTVMSLDSNNCTHFLHSNEDMSILNYVDPLYPIKKSGRYLTYERTIGISTTSLFYRLHNYIMNKSIQYNTDNAYLYNIIDTLKMYLPVKKNIHYLYHSWDLLCSSHVNYLVNYKQKWNCSIVACISLDDKTIYNQLERAIMLLSIKEIDDIVFETPESYKKDWKSIDIDFNKDEFIHNLVLKINNDTHLNSKLFKSLSL